MVALGIAEGGEKHVLGVWQGATENTTVVKGLLEDLVDRGLNRQRRYLVVMDGSKALRAGVERVFGEQVEVQRCQIHKRRNVKEYLPENCQKDYDRRMRNAYAMNNYAEAKEALQKIFRQLERINPSAARSLEEGLEETLTVHRLSIGTVLRRKLATTNPIESCLSTVQRVARNVKRWREGDQPLRWTATGLLEAEKKFRRIGISRNPFAEGTPESVAPSAEGGPDTGSRLNLVAGRLTVPNIESRCNQLKLGHPRAISRNLIGRPDKPILEQRASRRVPLTA